jgi:hypothetical protein
MNPYRIDSKWTSGPGRILEGVQRALPRCELNKGGGRVHKGIHHQITRPE